MKAIAEFSLVDATLEIAKAITDRIDESCRVARAAGFDLAVGEPLWREINVRQSVGEWAVPMRFIRPGAELPYDRAWTIYQTGAGRAKGGRDG